MMMDNIDKFDNYQLSTVIRSFLRAFRGRSYGKDKHMISLEPHILKRMKDFKIRELSFIMNWYALREMGNPDLHKQFVKKIEENVDQLDWLSLHNVIYYLIYRDYKGKDLWENLID